MNDFTIEELEQLIWLAKNIPYRMSDYPIFEKIQSMIDNYDVKTIEAWHCEKCGHVQ